MHLLIFNCWSHSLTFHLLNAKEKKLLATGSIERLTLGEGMISIAVTGRKKQNFSTEYIDHRSAIKAVVDLLTDSAHGLLQEPEKIDVVAHRVVHGGEKFLGGTFLDKEVLRSLRDLTALAPLHLPHNIAGIEGSLDLLPDIPQIAVFDTAFHQTIPRDAYLYAVPYEWYENNGVRRYGFHGHAHRYASRRARSLMGKEDEECNVVTVVLGRGISVCAVRNGQSVDTSMGLTPLEGVTMDTRCGDIDPGLTTFMMERLNLSPPEVYQILNEKSGLLGIAGSASRAELIERSSMGDLQATLALGIQAYRIRKQIGGFLAGLGRTDAIVFSADEMSFEWQLREQSLEGLGSMGIRLDSVKNRQACHDREEFISSVDSPISIVSLPAHPEMEICEEVVSLLE